MKKILSLLVLSFATCAHADGLSALDAFIKNTKTGRADFVQTVTQPEREGRASRQKVSKGEFLFSRPNRFKFVYAKPFEQVIVADGQTLWLHDLDLNQVTARSQTSAMTGSPAALFASASDMRALQTEFDLKVAPDKDGLEWVVATPRAKGQSGESASLNQSIRVGFRQSAAGVEIATLEVMDSFGQRSVIQFSKSQTNAGVSAADFAFKPPVGVQLLKQ